VSWIDRRFLFFEEFGKSLHQRLHSFLLSGLFSLVLEDFDASFACVVLNFRQGMLLFDEHVQDIISE